MNLQEHSFSVFQLELKTKETDHPMGTGTGFCISFKKKKYLVTNYHIASGLLPGTTKTLHQSGAIPGNFAFDCTLTKQISETEFKHKGFRIESSFYDENDDKIWIEHPTMGNECDIVVIELNKILNSKLPDEFEIRPISIERAEGYQAKINVMDTVFITGYPLPKNQTLTKFPIYKFGRVASEPDDVQNGNRFYIDSKTKPGMSGSPIIQKEEGEFVKNGRNYQFRKGRLNFIGIYSGRAEIRKDEYEAELGIIWPYKKYLMPILESI